MKILIIGALPKDQEREDLYNAMIDVCKEYAEEVSSPIDTADFPGDEKATYRRAVKKVKEAGLIIGEQSKPSTGQGIEIGIATTLDIPLIVVAESSSKVSEVVQGCDILQAIIYYDNIEDLKRQLKKEIEKIKQKTNS